jgi:DNA (cytosine-5)-methyltransferase 1
MAHRPTDNLRVITVTAANLRQSHLYLNGTVGFFPKDSIGPASARTGVGREVQLDVAGLDKPVFTDLPVDAKSGRPRGIFRRRAWVKEFFATHKIKAGDAVIIERKGPFQYEVRPSSVPDRFAVAEFFAGIGLVRLAFERHGCDTVFANDIDPQKLEIYKDNFGDEDFALGDIHKLKADDVPDADVYTASFPCNDLSIAGAMAGLNGKESGAFWGLIRILKQKRKQGNQPKVVLLENVPGFLMSHNGKDLETALKAINDLGYSVDLMIIDAARFVPQSRARLFVVAQFGVAGHHPAGVEPSAVRTKPLVDFILAHKDSIRWSIRDLPSVPHLRPKLADIIEDLPIDDPAWWDAERTAYFMNQLSDRHAQAAQEMIAGPRYSYATAFRRVRNGRSMAELRTDGIAGCLRTPRGGSGRQILFKAGRGAHQVRLLTARECARLQGVPDTYRISVPLNQALFGFGDAVCVPVVAWIVENYIRPVLEGKVAPVAARSLLLSV